MRHRVHGRKLGRTTAHRKALFRNQLTALFTHERIITTVAKAKELRPIAERMVTMARTGTLAARRKVATMVPDKEIARRLFDEIAPRFADRPGGYTRIMRLGRRHGDNAELAIIEFIDYDFTEHQDAGDGEAKGSLLDRAKGVFGGGAADEAASTDDETTETVEAAEVETEAVDEAPVEAPADEPEVTAEAVAEEPEEAPVETEPVEAVAEEPAEVAADAEPEAQAEPADEPEATDETDEEKKDA